MHTTTLISLKNITRKFNAKDHLLYDPIYMNVQKRPLYGDRKQTSGCLGLQVQA